jgi:multidrug resistance efflux pump
MAFRGPKVRDDLAYHNQVIEDEEVVVVQDPIRSMFYRFNLLQAAMLRSLDGHRTAEEITAILSVEYGVEIPPIAAERFITRARELLLLDITSYLVTPEKARKQVSKALRKAGFRERLPSNETSHPPRARVLSAETMVFAEAFRQLDLGHPRAAAMYLKGILEKNPNNARAKQLYDLIQKAYIKAAGGMTTDYPTWVIFDPSRLLTWVSRTIGRFLFAWPGVIAILVLVSLGVYSYTLISFEHVTTDAFDIVLAVVFIVIIHPFFHEFGHGLACQHYGGHVTEIGYILFFYFRPTPFCDTSSSYLITNRRHKVIIQLAGSIASLVTISTTTIVVSLLSPEVPIYSGLSLGLTFSSALMFITLLPFLKLDGYYAVADAVGFPNLRERAMKITRAWLSKRLLGIEIKTEELPPRTRKLLIIYGILARTFTLCFVLFVFIRFMITPLVMFFRGAGLIFAIALCTYVWRNIALRPMWAGVRMIVRERRKIFTARRTAVLFALMTALIAPWFVLQLPVHVDSGFEVVPYQRAEVRAQTTGRVDEILVKEGDHVRRGDPLAILRNPGLRARVAKLEAEREIASHHLADVRDGARAEELALAESRVARAQAEVGRSAGEARTASKLAAAHLGTQDSADTARGDVAAHVGAAGAAQGAVAILKAGPRAEDIKVAEAECARIDSQLEHLRTEESLLTLRSPIDGIVATPRLKGKLQMTLKPGDLFAEVHDVSSVVAEMALSPADPLSDIKVGDEVALRLYAAPYGEVAVRVDRFRLATTPDSDGERRVVVVTSPFVLDRPVSGLTGHARIYGEERSLAYAYFYLPVERLVHVTLWSMF